MALAQSRKGSVRTARCACFVVCIALVLAAGCSKKEPSSTQQAAGQAAPVETSAPPIVVAMIDAHGGMASWRSAKTVYFECESRSPRDSVATTAHVMVDNRTRRAYLDFPETGQSMAWDGKRAWSMHWTRHTPPRFLALLNYYFLDLPWLTMDPGVKLTVAGTDTLWGDPTEFNVVNMTFMPGTGDTPRDTYRLYIDPASKQLKACAYTVTYRALLPDSVQSTPEHILVYEDYKKVDGMLMPSRYTIYSTDHQPLSTCSVDEWAFDKPFDESRMQMPDSAVVDESKP
ncbi:MAG TPA: hypothetical protein VFH88_12965 [Candidatus Krumholzibacteria bacterium]|nr:hypothetical protein [Candidatus Krumholzibacteria bacterium]